MSRLIPGSFTYHTTIHGISMAPGGIQPTRLITGGHQVYGWGSAYITGPAYTSGTLTGPGAISIGTTITSISMCTKGRGMSGMTTGEQSPAAGVTHPVIVVAWPTVISPQPVNTASTTAEPGISGMKQGGSLNQEIGTGHAPTTGKELIGVHAWMAEQKSSGRPRAGSVVTLTDKTVNGPTALSSSDQGWNLIGSPGRELNVTSRCSSVQKLNLRDRCGSELNPAARYSSDQGWNLIGSPGSELNVTSRCSSGQKSNLRDRCGSELNPAARYSSSQGLKLKDGPGSE